MPLEFSSLGMCLFWCAVPLQGVHSNTVENQFTSYGIAGAWWDSTVSSRASQRQSEESCGFYVGSMFPLCWGYQGGITLTSLHCVHRTVFSNSVCIFKSRYTSGCEGDRLACFLITHWDFLGENPFVLGSGIMKYKLFMTQVLCAGEHKAEVFQITSINAKNENFKLKCLQQDPDLWELLNSQVFSPWKYPKWCGCFRHPAGTQRGNGCGDTDISITFSGVKMLIGCSGVCKLWKLD